jgi:hypothetical protein
MTTAAELRFQVISSVITESNRHFVLIAQHRGVGITASGMTGRHAPGGRIPLAATIVAARRMRSAYNPGRRDNGRVHQRLPLGLPGSATPLGGIGDPSACRSPAPVRPMPPCRFHAGATRTVSARPPAESDARRRRLFCICTTLKSRKYLLKFGHKVSHALEADIWREFLSASRCLEAHP